MLSNLIAQLKAAHAEDKYDEVLQEVPQVRKDFGYPPLVTPTSQIVGAQAVCNVLSGKRYSVFPKESKALLKGAYGLLPGPVNEEVRRMALQDEPLITCRPADLIKPQLEESLKNAPSYIHSEEELLSYVLFPDVASNFYEKQKLKGTASLAHTSSASSSNIRCLYVEDLETLKA